MTYKIWDENTLRQDGMTEMQENINRMRMYSSLFHFKS